MARYLKLLPKSTSTPDLKNQLPPLFSLLLKNHLKAVFSFSKVLTITQKPLFENLESKICRSWINYFFTWVVPHVTLWGCIETTWAWKTIICMIIWSIWTIVHMDPIGQAGKPEYLNFWGLKWQTEVLNSLESIFCYFTVKEISTWRKGAFISILFS